MHLLITRTIHLIIKHQMVDVLFSGTAKYAEICTNHDPGKMIQRGHVRRAREGSACKYDKDRKIDCSIR